MSVDDIVASEALDVLVNPETVLVLGVLALVGKVMAPRVVAPSVTVVDVEPPVPPLAFKVMVYVFVGSCPDLISNV